MEEFLGPGELGVRIGYSVSGVKKLERLGVIKPALRMAGTNRRVWKGTDVPEIQEQVRRRREAGEEKARYVRRAT